MGEFFRNAEGITGIPDIWVQYFMFDIKQLTYSRALCSIAVHCSYILYILIRFLKIT